MNDKPSRNERLIEELEACRPGSLPSSDPALAHLAAAMAADPRWEELHDRLQLIDIRLAAAMHDVPVPTGLANRLLERLKQQHDNCSPRLPGEGQGVRAATRHQQDSDGIRWLLRRRVSRRWLLGGVVSLGTAAALLVAVLIGMQNRQPYANSFVLEKAIEFFNAESPEADRADPPPSDYPLSRDVVRFGTLRWRPISNFLARDGVAYDLSGAGGSRGTLYVIHCEVNGAPAAPPVIPSFTTANCSTSAWHDGQLLYVLVVSGGQESYRRYLKPMEAV